MHEKELRLSLVCYGGISLAVYMHGITKEVWHLVRASRARADGTPTTDSEAIYADLLGEMEESAGIRVRVLADIVAGASAGGINGIFLAQAVTSGQSLDALTDLWLAGADVEALIDPPASPHSRFSKMWALPLAWAAAGRSADGTDQVDVATREEVRAKLSHFVRSRWFEPPFGGDTFTGLLLDAFDAMASGPRGPRLLPPGQPLDLFVTVTDFTGHPERLTLNSPPEVIETEHRLVIGFSDGGMPVEALAAAPELAFAARATSSFPGAFPPFTVRELDRVLQARGVAWPSRRDFLSRVLPRHTAAGAGEAVLIDGSVLANAPFRPAIEALAQRPARREIDRRFVYIDPSPGTKIRLSGAAGEPGFFQTILGAISELPRKQPIRDNLEAIAERSTRIDRLRRVVTAIRPRLEAEVEQLFGYTLFLDRPTAARLAAWRKRAQSAAASRAGYTYLAYGQLKVAAIVDSLARLLDQVAGKRGGETRRKRLRAQLEGAVAASGGGGSGSQSDDAKAVEFLRQFDLGFRIRRLRFLARRVAELEGEGAEIAVTRDAVYASLAPYLDLQRTEAHPNLPAGLHSDTLLDTIAAAYDLPRHDAATDARLADALAKLDKDARRPLLLAYLGFVHFDIATLPMLGGEGLDEFDAIKVDRIAPDDATAIRSGGAEATLKGIRFNSFGAFFSRTYRENDYLWGRLHGAERMIDITISTLPVRLRAGRISAIKRAVFLAILDEEQPRLTAIAPLFATLRREIG